jgi:PAS domain-containing protein
MLDQSILAALEKRRHQFLNFRWLLLIWAGSMTLARTGTRFEIGPDLLLLCLIALSQAALKFLPVRFLEGTRVLTAIFLLDLAFMVAALQLADRNNSALMVALSLSTVLAAISHRLSFAFLTALFSAGAYLAVQPKAQEELLAGPLGVLVLPFLFIASAHASLLAQESDQEVEARQQLVQGKRQLSKHLNNTFMEIARTCKDLTALVDALPLGTLMLDESGRVRVMNDIAAELLEANRSEVLTQTLPEAKLAYLEPYVANAFSEPATDLITVQLQPSSGKPFPVGLGVYPIFDADHLDRGLLVLLVPEGVREEVSLALRPQSDHWAFVRSQSHHPLARVGQASGGAMSLGALGLSYG